MKKLLISIVAIIAILAVSVPGAYATLINLNDGTDYVVYDDVNNRYWVYDLTMYVSQTYQAQLDSIESDDGYFGLYGWHMARYDEMVTLWDYDGFAIGDAFNPVYVGSFAQYSGRYDEAVIGEEGRHYVGLVNVKVDTWATKSALNGGNHVDDTLEGSYIGAWVTTTPVPEPTTMLLLGSGLVGLAGFRKKFKK